MTVLPDMTKLMRQFPFMFPDTVDVQELGEATVTDSGAIIPAGWQDVSGLTDLKCLIESSIRSRTREGEVLSPDGQISKSTFTILFDRVYSGIEERHQLVDQDGKRYQIIEATRDDFSAGTVLQAQELKP